MRSIKRLCTGALLLLTVGSVSMYPGQAADDVAISSPEKSPKMKLDLPAKATPLGLKFPRRTASDAEQLSEENMLTDLRDTRLCLTQMKQQAINLFQEATRTVITASIDPLEVTPNTVNAQMLKEGEKYMPPRKEWLFFYINTLEPIVHLLTEDIQDVDTNGRKSWPEIEKKVNPLWSKWQSDIQAINGAVDQVQEHVEDDGTNLAVAKAAITIYERAEQLELVRYKVALIFREEFKKKKKEQKSEVKTQTKN